jgi:hypothetical protein
VAHLALRASKIALAAPGWPIQLSALHFLQEVNVTYHPVNGKISSPGFPALRYLFAAGLARPDGCHLRERGNPNPVAPTSFF